MKPAKGLSHELPEELPAGEHVLWQGAPGFRAAARLFHIRPVILYFAALLVWVAATRFAAGPHAVLLSLLRFGGLSLFCIGLFALYAYVVAATTSYTFTTRRLVLQVGIALPVSINVPWDKIASADIRRHADGTGEIRLTMMPGDRVNYIMLWPHVSAGKYGARPTLLAVPQVDTVARIMARQLSASSDDAAAVTGAAKMSATEPSPLPRAAMA